MAIVVGRVYSIRKQNSHVYFVDVLSALPGGSVAWGLRCTELCIREGPGTEREAIKVGDVLRAHGAVEASTAVRPPRHQIVAVSQFEIIEPWATTFGKKSYAFHLPSVLQRWKALDPPDELCRGKPICVLQCHMPLASRVATLFDGIVATALTKDRLVYLFDDNASTAMFVSEMKHGVIPFFLHGIIQRIYFLTKDAVACTTLEDVVDLLANSHEEEMSQSDEPRFTECISKIIAFPRELQTILGERLLERRSERDPAKKRKANPGAQRSGDYDSIVYVDGIFWTAFGVPRVVVPEKSSAVPSSAYYKLLEIKDRYLRREGLFEKYSGRELAVDIGASPGGWSYCLCSTFNTTRVIAVDPATQFHPLVTTLFESKRVEHFQMRGEEGLRLLKAKTQDRIGVYVCDMNDDCRATVALFKAALSPELDLIDTEKGCLVVLTFKNTCKRKSDFVARKMECLEQLQEIAAVHSLEECHLFANTKLETTIVFQCGLPGNLGQQGGRAAGEPPGARG